MIEEEQTEEGTWEDEDDRVQRFYITTNEEYHLKELPNIIRFTDCLPGEVQIWEKRTLPRAQKEGSQ